MNAAAVIPTYNERGNIDHLLEQIYTYAPDLHVWIVDGNSPDGTGAYVEELTRQYPGRLFLIQQQHKAGQGRAYVEGFLKTLAAQYEFIFQMDADLSHDPRFIPAFLDEIRSCDLVIGSRYLGGIRIMNWALWRLILSQAATRYVQIFTGMRFSDTTTGFKCWRQTALNAIGIEDVFSSGYLFHIETTCKAFRKGLRIKEVPIVFYERQFGRSKFDWQIIFEAFFGVLRLWLTR